MPSNPKDRMEGIERVSRQARQNGSDPLATDESMPGMPINPQNYDPDMPRPLNIGFETVRYAGITSTDGVGAGLKASSVGVWVKVKLGPYSGMSVLFRTSNRTKVRLAIPDHARPAELDALDAQQKASEVYVRAYLDKDEVPPDEAMDAFTAATEVATKAFARWGQQMRHERAAWVSMFAVDFSPWPFEDIEKPDPARPETYVTLADELEDLFDWLVSLEGYNQALEESAKNS